MSGKAGFDLIRVATEALWSLIQLKQTSFNQCLEASMPHSWLLSLQDGKSHPFLEHNVKYIFSNSFDVRV